MIKVIDKTTKKYCYLLLFACWFVYIVSIALKMIYSAQLSVIMQEFSVSNSQVSLGLTIYYIVYASAQLVIAATIKKINIKAIFSIFTFLSAISFSLIAFINQIWQLWIILGLNGIFQSCIWIGVIYFIGKYFPNELVGKATNIMGAGFAFGSALSYGASALFTEILSWKATFVFMSILCAVSMILFLFVLKKVSKNLPEQKTVVSEQPTLKDATNNKTISTKVFVLIMTCLFISMFFLTATYYGMSNWITVFLNEVFNISDTYSMLISILVPISVAFGMIVVCRSCEKHRNYFATNSLWILAIAILSIVLCFVYKINIIISLLLNILLLTISKGCNNIFGIYIQLKMRDKIDAGKNAGIMNVAASLAASLTPLITGLVLDGFGWDINYIVIAIMGVVAVLFLIPLIILKNKNKL